MHSPENAVILPTSRPARMWTAAIASLPGSPEREMYARYLVAFHVPEWNGNYYFPRRQLINQIAYEYHSNLTGGILMEISKFDSQIKYYSNQSMTVHYKARTYV